MKETASVSIKYQTYERLKSYCSDNGLKIIDIASKFIHEGLMKEMYGDIPYGQIKTPFNIIAIPDETQDISEQNVHENKEPLSGEDSLKRWLEIGANEKTNSLGEIIEEEKPTIEPKRNRGKRTLK